MASFEMVKSHPSLENARLGEKGPNKSTVVAIGISTSLGKTGSSSF